MNMFGETCPEGIPRLFERDPRTGARYLDLLRVNRLIALKGPHLDALLPALDKSWRLEFLGRRTTGLCANCRMPACPARSPGFRRTPDRRRWASPMRQASSSIAASAAADQGHLRPAVVAGLPGGVSTVGRLPCAPIAWFFGRSRRAAAPGPAILACATGRLTCAVACQRRDFGWP
jgi:hypothetical protein